MSFSMLCPECRKVLDFEDEKEMLRVRCPRCGAGFIAREADLSADQIEELRRRESDQWERRQRRPPGRTVREEVSGPATGLKVLGWLGVIPGFLLIALGVFIATVPANDAEFQQAEKTTREETLLVAWVQIAQGMCGIITGLVMLIGSRKMTRLEGRGWAKVAAVLGMLPVVSGCCFLGIPIGIWTLRILSQPHVREYFDEYKPKSNSS
jgi:hypothetical protein